MSDSKHFDKIAIVAVVLAVILTLWFMTGGGGLLTPANEVEEEYLTDEKVQELIETQSPTTVTLDGDTGEVDGKGAGISFGNLSITDGGVYVVSGTLTDGEIVVNAGGSDVVCIVLDGADITCPDDSAILVQNAGAVYLWTTEGSENSITTGADMESSTDAVAAGREGALYTRDDLILAGRGTLNIISEYEHGIVQDDNEDTIIFLSGTYNITSVGKGIKSDNTLEIDGGDITIDAEDDAVHADSDVTLSGGSMTISSADDGIHSDTAVYLNGTDITVTEAYEGVEAPIIEMNGGDINITSTDDGFNGNGTGIEDTLVTVNDGKLTILNPTGRDADGLDSNGSIVINGGYIYISLTGGGTNSALDFGSESGGTCTINGGTVIAAGGSGMLEAISENSSQASITMVYDTTYEAGTTVTVTDADGNEIISQLVDDSMSAVTLSAEGIENGGTYTVTTGEDSEEVTLDAINYSNTELTGMMGGGFGGGMGGHRGGGRQFGMNESGDSSQSTGTNGQSTDSTTGSDSSQPPQMPEQGTDTTGSTDGTASSDTNAQPTGNPMAMGGGMGGGQGEWDMDNQTTQITWYTPTATDWVYIAIGALVILAAIIFAAVFHRRKRK